MQKNNTGITGILFYGVLKNKQAEAIIDAMRFTDHCVTVHDDPYTGTYEIINFSFADRGVIVTVSQFNESPWGLYVYVSPAMALGDNGLYQPDGKRYQKLEKSVNKILSKLRCPQRLADMKLSRVSIAADIKLPSSKTVIDYIALLQQGCLPRHYDPGTQGSPHFCCQSCKRMTFIAYDAAGICLMDGKQLATPMGRTTLRLQLSMRRKAIRRKLKGGIPLDHSKVMRQLMGLEKQMLIQQLRAMKLHAGRFVPYDDARKMVSSVKDKKTRTRMKYLLKKAHELANLDLAIAKLKEKHHLVNRQANRVIKQFHKLGISPLTLPDSSKDDLPDLMTLL